jgi:hypothetical protein
MPHHVYRCGVPPRLDLCHNLCVTLTTCEIVSFPVLTMYVSACCLAMCVGHAGVKDEETAATAADLRVQAGHLVFGDYSCWTVLRERP